jgi:hypothetical protein
VMSTLLPARLSIALRDRPSGLSFLHTLHAGIEGRVPREGCACDLSLHRRLPLMPYFDDGFDRTVAAVSLDFEGLRSLLKGKAVRDEGL